MLWCYFKSLKVFTGHGKDFTIFMFELLGWFLLFPFLSFKFNK